MPHYDFVEIGTSDFDTLIQSANDTSIGLSVDPLQIYLDRLPSKKNVTKVCAAITGSLIGKSIDVFYVEPVDIIKNNFHDWIRGCNSIQSKHPTVSKYLQSLNLENLLQKKTVPMLTVKDLFEIYQVQSVDTLKIDTEGHDCNILSGLLTYCETKPLALPDTIYFEANSLTPTSEIDATLQRLFEFNYSIVSRRDNILVQRIR